MYLAASISTIFRPAAAIGIILPEVV